MVRHLLAAFALLAFLMTAPAPSLAVASAQKTMKLTIYNDGLSCPGGCDAHVVLNPADNGTRYAFRPDSARNAPKKCLKGQSCQICFGEADGSCMTALYRGGGPPVGTFDFTPAFYKAECGKPANPEALRLQCKALDQTVSQRGYDKRINCFLQVDHPKCQDVLQKARAAQAVDTPKRAQCLAIGEAAYNKKQTDPKERRALDCNYTELSLGGSGTKHWRRLLPGACPAGAFVGQDGLDCCTVDVRYAAHVHRECALLYPAP
ncbi:hypothetical protein [Caulobacter rhizosphaerae]|jgi:hypothetical protein|uniref:hypothetical protein n=1 Tax=Caulobacter rhizosphaerae TaxID=2010972 RepID=UPI0013D59424|nr:hypothetical protein [Caulobacter rhizosphaerae]